MTKLKPIFKSSKSNFISWILKNTPSKDEYEYFIEPYVSLTNLFLFKEKSKTEILGDQNVNIISIYKNLRDKPKDYLKNLKKIKYSLESFEEFSTKITNDTFEKGMKEFVISKMSKKDNKQGFAGGKDTNWKKSISTLPDTCKRIKDCFIIEKTPFEIIKAFDDKQSFCFVNPPDIDDPKFCDFDSICMSTDDHIELSKLVSDYAGKVMIIGYQSTLYKRLYKGWNCEKRINEKEENKYKKTECIWKNY